MAALAPVALRLLPALGAAAAGGAGYEAIEQGYRRIKNKVLDRRSRSESKNRSRSESRGSGKKHRGNQRRRSSRSTSRSSSSSSDEKYGHRRQERENRVRHRRSQTTSSRYDQRHWTIDGDELNPQTGALVLRRESSSDIAIPRRPNIHRTTSDPRPPPPQDPQPVRPPYPHPAHQPHTSDRIPNPQEPPRPQERGFSSETEFRIYERAIKTDPEVLSRQSIHPMTPEQDKRMARRVLLEKGWRPRLQTGDRERYLMRRDFLSPARRQALEGSGEELFSPAELRAQEQVRRGQSQSPGHGPYREDHDSWGARGGTPSLQPGERYDERRSRSQQSRYMGGRPSR
jgi:hypothetical protein